MRYKENELALEVSVSRRPWFIAAGVILAVGVTAFSGVLRRPHPPLEGLPSGGSRSSPSVPPYSDGEVLIPPDARVSTLVELQQALTAAANQRLPCLRPYVIWVENRASIDVGAIHDHRPPPSDGRGSILQVPPCVTLASGRSSTEPGGLLFISNSDVNPRYMLALGNASRVTGLRLRGPSASSDADTVDRRAILIQTISSASVDNDEIFNWPGVAVDIIGVATNDITESQMRISSNFIHDNDMCGSGYGVAIGTQGFVHIDRNVFNYNRHAITSDGCVANQAGCLGNTGYIAELNFILSGGATCSANYVPFVHYYNQHLDVHGSGSGCGTESHCGGTAGQLFDVHHNAIRGAQTYFSAGPFFHRTRPAVQLRGSPAEAYFFHDNSVEHEDFDAAFSIKPNSPEPRFFVSHVQYGVETSGELAVGDFDGDGAADVFQATRAVWVYSPRGSREWRFLNQSSTRLSRLRFVNFDGNNKTDIFTQEGDKWLVSYDAVGPWTELPVGSNIDMSNYGFADFDGDAKTDIFETNGQEWLIAHDGVEGWKHLNFSKIGIKDLRFGDFNADLHADAFAIVNGQWSVSWSGTSKWERLNDELSSDINELVLADFNGDGKTDIARSNTTGYWEVSWGGTTPWHTLRTWTVLMDKTYLPLTALLIGDFDGDHHADALTTGTCKDIDAVPGPHCPGQNTIPSLDTFFFLSSAAASSFVERSLNPMK
jgi:hypothetical protein